MKTRCMLILYLILGYALEAPAQGTLHILLEIGADYKGNAYGRGVLGLPDINNDGWPDLAVSSKTLRQTLIYFGGPGILDDTADVFLKGAGPIRKGDVNGDGLMDVISRGWQDSTTNYTHPVFVYLGQEPDPLALDTVHYLTLLPEIVIQDVYGEYIAVGDLNNDGYDDIVVSGRSYGRLQGAVDIYMGGDTIYTSPTFTAIGDSAEEYFGYYVSTGDINGDGYVDMAVSADSRRTPRTIDIWYGGPNFTFARNNYRQRFYIIYDWELMFSLVDFNSDGLADLNYSNNHDSFFHFSVGDSLSATPSFVLPPDTIWIIMPYWSGAVSIGDVNGDGIDDFALRNAASGWGDMCVRVFLGSPGHAPTEWVAGRCRGNVRQNDAFLQRVPVGDLNGDGVSDFAASAPVGSYPTTVQDGYVAVFSGNKLWTHVEDDPPFPPNTSTVEVLTPLPDEVSLSQNYPNPFNPQTTIQYSLSQSGHIELLIADNLGRPVRTLADKIEPAGTHTIQWDGTDDDGREVASGSYFYRLRVDGNLREVKKLTIVR